ncbi:Maf family nucleotide pyrophosphatase [Chitinimonas lacunae]|uniref:7-methyl-GTP pyrophosphatase n=1 Tax=Chitinimonas lacunae TaxID=1963018 RepID=A0ABV8MQR4_9NEIS
MALSPLPLILGSTSPYRRELLERLQVPFEVARPDCDETPLPGESAAATANRLARLKAQSLVASHPAALIIGSDQVALLDGRQLGKPGDFERARLQLQAMRGQTLVFHTALCLINSASGTLQEAVVPYHVTMRDYSDAEIDAYLHKEQPYDCAGSAKTEGLGIAMIAAMQGSDPTAIVGLPLIELCNMLRREGFPLL